SLVAAAPALRLPPSGTGRADTQEINLTAQNSTLSNNPGVVPRVDHHVSATSARFGRRPGKAHRDHGAATLSGRCEGDASVPLRRLPHDRQAESGPGQGPRLRRTVEPIE